MTLRHPERLGPDSDDENSYTFSSEDEDQNHQTVTWYQAAHNPNPPLPGAPLGLPIPTLRAPTVVPEKKQRKTPFTDDILKIPHLHPFQTDFGPDSIIGYLRSEVDKIKRDREATSGKGKGKQRETAEPAAFGLIDAYANQPPAASSSLTSYPRTLTDKSNREDSSSGLPARRSLRLSRKDSSIRSVAAPNNTQTSQSPLPTPFLPAQQASSQPVDFSSQASRTRSARASTFEEYTKNKRNAVRNNAQDTPTNPLRAKLRETKLPKSLSLPGSSLDETASPSVAASISHEIPSWSRQDSDDHTAQQGPSAENGRCGQATATRKKVGTKPLTRKPSIAGLSLPSNGGISVRRHPAGSRPHASGLDIAQDREHHTFIPSFEYDAIVPEAIPQGDKKDFLDKVSHAKHSQLAEPEPEVQQANQGWKLKAVKLKKKEESVVTEPKQYPRVWRPSNALGVPVPATVAKSSRARSPNNSKAPKPQTSAIWKFDVDLWTEISEFLSTQDVKNLRLVCRSLAETLAPIQLRNVVVNFGRNFFDIRDTGCGSRTGYPSMDSMFKKYGDNINQFGISFEYDLHGLSYAKAKVIEKEQHAWFGKFTWPTEQYPRFPALQAIEDLVDHNIPLLKEAIEKITKASELGLCIDSGHGWLEGPDISDMALFNRRIGKGSKIFGKTFKTEDVWITFARNELFRWGQQNTINGTLKSILTKQPPSDSNAKEVRFLDGLKIRDIESFRRQSEQYDYDSEHHTGGLAIVIDEDAAAAVVLNQPGVHAPNLVNASAAVRHRRALNQARNTNRRQPQWPLIFNSHNLAAEHGGHLAAIQNKTGHPGSSRLLPGMLTEAQAQWLMETVWAQRAFLSAYTTAIITHKHSFKGIHTLRISRLSSGLLPSLEQREFWKTLSGLNKLEIYIKPDWRQEHVTGDKAFAHNMPICPAKAAERFTEFLSRYITKLENLHSLSVGYVGGGEHAVGIYARNMHVLPAPIVDDPNEWLLEPGKKHIPLLTKFDHVRELKFENCWFTPWMLKEFMERSRDTSLHSLTLESVSMTTCHDESIEKPLGTVKDGLRCLHSRRDWPRENLPSGAAWTRALDAITPGKPLREHKYDAGLIDRDEHPMPPRLFRGHVQQITLNSCGYVKISLPKGRSTTYNQNSAVEHSDSPMDQGLRARKDRFSGFSMGAERTDFDIRSRDRLARLNDNFDKPNKIMMSTEGFPWLGTLTQCIHPIEKRILEEAWQMRFGWPDHLDRWGAVEDGEFEGGTGRFSGVIKKDDHPVQGLSS